MKQKVLLGSCLLPIETFLLAVGQGGGAAVVVDGWQVFRLLQSLSWLVMSHVDWLLVQEVVLDG